MEGQQQMPKPTESKPLLSEPNQQRLRRSINLDELRSAKDGKSLAVHSTVRKYSDSYLDELLDDMQQSTVEHRYEKNAHSRKLSHTRGIHLPIIKLNEANRPKSIPLVELKRDYSPPIANSPIGYTLRHDDLLATDLNRSTHSESFNVDPNGEENVVDIRIFLANGKAIQLQVENGLEAMAADLLQLMADEYLQIDEDVVNQSLALWLISPLFELQLKPYHLAYELFDKWPLFLRRFTCASEQQIADDEPLIVLRRNVHLTIPVEIMYLNQYEGLTEIFYFDAKDEFMSGRYIVDLATCVKVAALQLAIENGPLDKNEDSHEVVHRNLQHIVPAYLIDRIKSFHLFGLIECKSGLEKQIIREYKNVSQQFTNNYERRKAYLNVLREQPLYGASFFDATTDRKQSNSILDMSKRLFVGSQQQVELLVGINCEYLTVIDKQKNEILLTRCISDCSWFCSSEAQNDDEDIPSFFIHFPDDKVLTQLDDGSNTPVSELPSGQAHLVSRLLQVFSKQASLMENLMNLFYDQNCCELVGSSEHIDSPASSSNTCPMGQTPQSEVNSPISTSNGNASNKSTTSKSSIGKYSTDISSPASSLQCSSRINKLCTATLDENGGVIEANGRLKRILLECN